MYPLQKTYHKDYNDSSGSPLHQTLPQHDCFPNDSECRNGILHSRYNHHQPEYVLKNYYHIFFTQQTSARFLKGVNSFNPK